ncbi:NADH-quinone oxidoreductase subunit C [Streptomyces sp. ME19-01-6]|uniref:NADH-quinone oxidoreductase subunit C n=1 Tax=Streptomyces sp. ME19-01-6 TaxID=3028686 RepID=UPI0029AD36DC|nr:NADH-quinone oxidoreductase subunit C [Streptomyces sp. ME19-01-6]MDX3226558.1 NADH-quinone oxidoreductase subunit C [Streptomyces sp. ME19-01-6]
MTAPDDRNQPVEAVAVPAPPTVGWLPRSATELFGEGATAEEAYGLLTVDVPADAWIPALETARDALGCTYFDWLSAVDEPGEGFRVAAHVVALGPAAAPAAPAVRGLLVRTTVTHDAPALPTATGVYAGAAWHERETHEMFGIDFAGHPHLAPLLLPDGFEGHPLRKDFVLAARVVKAWPGAKEPGESEAAHAPRRRQMLPPGVPDPNEWGPLKGQLPPAPARPARATRTAGAAGASGAGPAGGERPPRRARSASAGSAGQRATTGAEASAGEGSASRRGTDAAEGEAARPARRSRSAGEGSASLRGTDAAEGEAARPARRSRSAGEGSASQRAATGGQAQARPDRPAARPRSADAPWHHPRPAREDEPTAPGTQSSESASGAAAAAAAAGEAEADTESRRDAGERREPSQTVAGEGVQASGVVESSPRSEAAGREAGDPGRHEGPQGPAQPAASEDAGGPDTPDAPAESDAPDAPAEPDTPAEAAAPAEPHKPRTPHAPHPNTDDPAGGTA